MLSNYDKIQEKFNIEKLVHKMLEYHSQKIIRKVWNVHYGTYYRHIPRQLYIVTYKAYF